MEYENSSQAALNRLETGSFWKLLRDSVLKNKLILWSTIFVAVLSYGFAITHYSIGVDDPAAWHYLHTDGELSMIQQGRLAHVLLEWLTGVVEFIPFFHDFLGVALFVASALALCGVFQYVTGGAFSAGSLAAFSGIYLSYSLINEKFIYNLDMIVTMLSYLAFAFALLYGYQFVYERKRKALPAAFAWTILSISSYESFIFLYVTGVFFLFLLKIFVNREKISFTQLLCKGLQFAAILAAACLVYYGAVVIVQLATQQFGKFNRDTRWSRSEGFWETFLLAWKRVAEGMRQRDYFPILVFDLAAALGGGIFAVLSIRKRTVSGFLCFLGFLLSNFLIHVAGCEVLYRAAQGYCFFVAGVALLLLYQLETLNRGTVRKWLLRGGYILAIYLVFLQAADLNRWFYNDYVRYQKEEFAIHSIATRLVAECDVSKPVVFTNRDYSSYLYSFRGDNQTNGNSMLTWAVGAFGEPTSPVMIELFRMHGYHFLQSPTYQQAVEAEKLAENMPPWPQKGSIQEFDQVIVVNFR